MQALSKVIELIRADIKETNRFVKDVRSRPHDDVILLYVSWKNVGPVVQKDYTSIKQLNLLKNRLSKQYSVSIEIVFLQSEGHFEMENGIFQLLNQQFPNQVKSFYISFKDGKTIDAWIEVEEQERNLRKKITSYLESILFPKMKLGVVQWFGIYDLPSTIAILRAIKIIQPVNIDELVERLRESHKGLNEKWLRNKLDHLRRDGYLRWSKPGNFTLTGKSLPLIPAGRQKSSSDIERALELGRRKW